MRSCMSRVTWMHHSPEKPDPLLFVYERQFHRGQAKLAYGSVCRQQYKWRDRVPRLKSDWKGITVPT